MAATDSSASWGRGGRGIVFLAHDEEPDRDIALKVHHGPIRDRDVQRLGREAKVMARLSHPNVAGVYQVATHEGMLYVAMEYVDGGTMRHWIDHTSPGWRELTELCVGIGEGLVAAHSVGIVHRDLKPDNVLVDRGGRARVADFGLPRDKAFGTRHARAAITLTHMGRTYLAEGNSAKAAEVLTVALEIREASHADPLYWAQTELELARARVGTDPEGVAALQASGRAGLAGQGSVGGLRRAIERVLACSAVL